MGAARRRRQQGFLAPQHYARLSWLTTSVVLTIWHRGPDGTKVIDERTELPCGDTADPKIRETIIDGLRAAGMTYEIGHPEDAELDDDLVQRAETNALLAAGPQFLVAWPTTWFEAHLVAHPTELVRAPCHDCHAPLEVNRLRLADVRTQYGEIPILCGNCTEQRMAAAAPRRIVFTGPTELLKAIGGDPTSTARRVTGPGEEPTA